MKIPRIVNYKFAYFFVVIILLTPSCVNHVQAMESLYNLKIQESKSDYKAVYFKHLNEAFKQNPDVINGLLIEQEKRKAYTKKVFTDQFGRHFVWDPRFGYIPHTTNYGNMPYPVTWVESHRGPMPVTNMMDPAFGGRRENPYLCVPHRKFSSIREPNKPMLSFYEPPVDPCTGKYHSEFGMTATSGMSDILCILCQYLKSVQCVWQFCSHPEGVYKYKRP